MRPPYKTKATSIATANRLPILPISLEASLAVTTAGTVGSGRAIVDPAPLMRIVVDLPPITTAVSENPGGVVIVTGRVAVTVVLVPVKVVVMLLTCVLVVVEFPIGVTVVFLRGAVVAGGTKLVVVSLGSLVELERAAALELEDAPAGRVGTWACRNQ